MTEDERALQLTTPDFNENEQQIPSTLLKNNNNSDNDKKVVDTDDDEPMDKSHSTTISSFDDVLDLLNPRGTWQLCIALACFTSCIAVNISSYAQGIFFVGKFEHACTAYANNNSNSAILTDNRQHLALPVTLSAENGSDLTCTTRDGVKCIAWNYSSPYYEHTLQSEWNLVCEQAYKIPFFQSSYVIGYLIGMPLFGAIADLYGRRIVILLSWPLLLISYGVTAFAPSYWLVAFMRALQGLLSGGDWKAKYVLTMEVTSVERRNLISVIIGNCFPVAALMAACMAYSIRNWRHLQLACILPALVALPLVLWLPESPRWLVTHAKYSRARNVLSRGAKFNGRKLPRSLDLEQLHDLHGQDDKVLASPLSRFRGLFATPEMRRRSYVLFVQSFVVELVFNGVMFYGTGVFPGDPYLTLLAMSVMRLLNSPLQVYLFDNYGCRSALIWLLLVTAATLGAVGILPSTAASGSFLHILNLVLIIAGNCFADACIGALDILTTELYPTSLRQTGFGLCSMWAQVGSAMSPFIAEMLAPIWSAFPAVVFSALCVFGIITTILWLPKHTGVQLPDTLNDTEISARAQCASNRAEDATLETKKRRGSLLHQVSKKSSTTN